jgi:large subunit ribosomal protein L25
MATATLAATARTSAGKGTARSLRRDGQIPGVIYGHARDSQPLALVARDLDKLLSHIAAESTVVELNIDGSVSRTLIREVQRHPFKRQILHIDFQELVAGEAVTVNVPIILVGTPEGVRHGGGMLDQVMRELSISVDPANMPNHYDLDVSHLTIGHALHVRDIVVGEGVTILVDPDETVCSVAIPKVAAEAVEEAEKTDGEPEVIRKAKADDEEESK